MLRLSATAMVLVISGLSGSAFADAARASAPAAPSAPDKEACVAAFDRGQRAQSDRALRLAQRELIVCAQESCPNVLRADCAGVLAEVQSALPTVVFAADDGNGHELTDVTVLRGDELLAPTLDGRAIPIDPGTFELRFVRAGTTLLTTTRTVREGEKSRVIRVSLPGGEAERRAGARDTRGVVGWAVPASLAAVGVAGVVTALVARAHFDSRVDGLRASCAPSCTPDQRDALSSIVVTSNVALGIGLAALALSVAAWFVTAPSSSSSASAHASPPGAWTW